MTVAFITPEICSKITINLNLYEFQLLFNKNMNSKTGNKLYTKFNNCSSHNSRDLQYFKDKQKLRSALNIKYSLRIPASCQSNIICLALVITEI